MYNFIKLLVKKFCQYLVKIESLTLLLKTERILMRIERTLIQKEPSSFCDVCSVVHVVAFVLLFVSPAFVSVFLV